MGHEHINTLLEMIITKITSKERVEQSINPESTRTKHMARDDVDGTDKVQKGKSYADVVRGNGENEINQSIDLILSR